MRSLRRRIDWMLGRRFPGIIWRDYVAAARRAGLERLYLILSFDCDTPEDAAAAVEVFERLEALGARSTFAVPGRELEENRGVYAELAGRGADFINHGARPHAERRDGAYHSVTFYHELPPAEVAEDIRRGHEMVAAVAGRPPRGFRAPHFGLFQRPEQLEAQYGVLRELGYRFSTSTVPARALRQGPVIDVGRLYEFPLSGSFRYHTEVLDSWGHVQSRRRPILRDRYADLFVETIDRLTAMQAPGVLNYYVDPAHVRQSPAFFRAVEHALARGLPSLRYGDLLGLIPPLASEESVPGTGED